MRSYILDFLPQRSGFPWTKETFVFFLSIHSFTEQTQESLLSIKHIVIVQRGEGMHPE